MCVYMRAHMIIESGKSKICRVGQQIGDPGKDHSAVQIQKPSADRIFFRLGDISLLFYSGLQLIG